MKYSLPVRRINGHGYTVDKGSMNIYCAAVSIGIRIMQLDAQLHNRACVHILDTSTGQHLKTLFRKRRPADRS